MQWQTYTHIQHMQAQHLSECTVYIYGMFYARQHMSIYVWNLHTREIQDMRIHSLSNPFVLVEPSAFSKLHVQTLPKQHTHRHRT